MQAIIGNEDLLKRALFGDASVYTGNDNDYDENDMCFCALSEIYDDNADGYVPNPNYDIDHYDYFFKGN